MKKPTDYDFRIDAWTPGTLPAVPVYKTPLAEEMVIHDHGELDGVVIRVGGRNDSVPVWLQSEDGFIYKNCNTNRQIAKDLALHLFGGPVRLAGFGRWRRNSNRVWKLEKFDIKSWQVLSDQSLFEMVKHLRSIEGSEWNEMSDSQQELQKFRRE